MNEKEGKTEAADSVLGFYGVELQSHAALAIGAFIGLFAVMQLAIVERPPSFKMAMVLSFVMAVLVVVVIYSVMRLVVYGGFANAILNEDLEGCVSHKSVTDKVQHFYFERYKASWWRRVTYYGFRPAPPKSTWQRALWRVWWLDARGAHQPRLVILLAILGLAWIASYGLIA